MMWSLYLWTILSLTLVQSAPIEDIGELSLDLLPPFENIRDSRQLTDSYGQPISSSYIQAESTPEGRKIAKTDDGIQFEIPTYASGIIDDRKAKDDASSVPISTSVINNPQSQIPLNVIIPKIEPHLHNSNIEFEIVKSMEIELKDIEPKVDHKRQSDEAQGSGIRAPVAIFDEQKQLFTHYRRQDYARKLKFDTPHNDLLPPINTDIAQNADDSESSQLLNENASSVPSTISSSVLSAPASIKENNVPHLELDLLPPFLDDHQIDESSHLNLTINERNNLDKKINIQELATDLVPPVEKIEQPFSKSDIDAAVSVTSQPALQESAKDQLHQNDTPETEDEAKTKVQQALKNNEVTVETPVTDLLPPHEESSSASNIETTKTTEIEQPLTENPQDQTTVQPKIKSRINTENLKSEEPLPNDENQNSKKQLETKKNTVDAPSIDLLPPHLEIIPDESNQPKEANENSQTQSHEKNIENKIDISESSSPVPKENANSLPTKLDVPELILDLLPPLKDGESVDLKTKPLLFNNEINKITNNAIKDINQLPLELLPPIIKDNKSATTNSINNKISTEKPLIPEGSDPPETTEKSLWQGDIYKGGFGGPSGFLGEQKDIGTVHKNSNQDLSTTEVIPKIEATTSLETTSVVSETTTHNVKGDHYEGDIYKGGFGGPVGFLGEQKDIGTYHQNSNQDLSSTEVIPNIEATTSLETTSVVSETTTHNVKGDHYEGDIYKGGFGGPVGFLGEQKDIGSFHKAALLTTTTVTPVTESTSIIQTTPAQIKEIPNPSNPFISNVGANTGILGEQINIGLDSNKIQVKSQEQNIIGTTTTPPTSLLSVSTTLASTNNIINKTSTAFPAFNFSPTSSDASGAIVPPSRLFQPPFLDSPNPKRNFKINVPNNNFSEPPSTSFAERLGFDKQKSTGANDIRFPSGNPPIIQTFDIKIPDNIPFDKSPSLSPATSQNPSPIAPANTFPQNIGQKSSIAVQPTNNINFGGAPGILGNQKPGYAVRPDGTIKDPDHEYKGPVATAPINKPVVVQKPVVQKPVFSAPPPSNANKYSGGFGGAPGILTPFDNGK